jgi:hypothetical protein
MKEKFHDVVNAECLFHFASASDVGKSAFEYLVRKHDALFQNEVPI